MRRIFFILPILFLLYACPAWEEETTEYIPVYMDRATLESTVGFQEAKQLETPGKIYYKSNKIYISERYKGVHVIDNSDPSNPQKLGFISASGCVDMAIKGSIIYLDNAVDLVAFDLTKLQVVKREKNVFPEPFPPDLNFMPDEYAQGNRGNDKIIIGWQLPN